MKNKSEKFVKDVKDNVHFLKEWAKDPKGIGSITPTSKQAAKLMVSQIPTNCDLPILELGPGTGIITSTMIEMGVEPSNITSIEFDKSFCDHLRKTYPEVDFVEGDAFNLYETLKDHPIKKFGAILSGIPLLNFKQPERLLLLKGALDLLEDGAPFVQLSYGPKPPVDVSGLNLSVTPTKWVLTNVPPARFWIYKKIKN